VWLALLIVGLTGACVGVAFVVFPRSRSLNKLGLHQTDTFHQSRATREMLSFLENSDFAEDPRTVSKPRRSAATLKTTQHPRRRKAKPNR
jgi:hypothetical protein